MSHLQLRVHVKNARDVGKEGVKYGPTYGCRFLTVDVIEDGESLTLDNPVSVQLDCHGDGDVLSDVGFELEAMLDDQDLAHDPQQVIALAQRAVMDRVLSQRQRLLLDDEIVADLA